MHDAAAATDDVTGPADQPPLSSSRPSSRQGYPEQQQPERPRSRQSQYDYERRGGAYDYRHDPRYAGYYGYGGYGEQDYYNQHQQRYMRGYEEEMRQYSAAGYVLTNRRVRATMRVLQKLSDLMTPINNFAMVDDSLCFKDVLCLMCHTSCVIKFRRFRRLRM